MVNGESPFMVTTTATGARYQLPLRPQVAWIGTVRIAMGCLGAAAALLCAADSFSQADTAPFAVQLLISLAAIPLAVLLIFHGLWLRLGYDEVVVEGGTLKGVRRVRGYGWTRSRNIVGLRRLCVACFRSARAAPSCALYAESDRGVPLTLAAGYPQDLLTALAKVVARRCQEQPQWRAASATPIAVTAVEVDAVKSFFWREGYGRVCLAGWVLMLVGSVLLAIGTVQWSSAAARRHWPSVPGTIVQSGIVTTERPKSRTKVMTTYYRAKLTYRYVVCGQSLEGEPRTMALSPRRWSNREVVKRIVARSPVGTSVTVFYNPRNPNTWVLDPGKGTIEAALLAFFGGAMLLCGLPIVAYQVGSRRAHILYQSGLAFDVRRSAGIGTLASSNLKSTFLVFIILASVLAVLTIGLLGLVVFLLR